jgi:hypothetical protein
MESSDKECFWCNLINDDNYSNAEALESAGIRRQGNSMESTDFPTSQEDVDNCLVAFGHGPSGMPAPPSVFDFEDFAQINAGAGVSGQLEFSWYMSEPHSQRVSDDDPQAETLQNEPQPLQELELLFDGNILVPPPRIELVFNLRLDLVEARGHKRRRLLEGERQEVAAKRGKVCKECRRRKIKVCL